MKMKLVLLSCLVATGLQGAASHLRLEKNAQDLKGIMVAFADWQNVFNDGESLDARGKRLGKLQKKTVKLAVYSILDATKLGLSDLLYYRRLISCVTEKDAVLEQLEDLSFNVDMLAWHAKRRAKAAQEEAARAREWWRS